MESFDMADVFLSYSRDDKEIMQQVRHKLRAAGVLVTLGIHSKTRGKASPAEIVATTGNLWLHPSSVQHNGLVNQGATESH
jgi:hypothetical protein